PESSQPETTSCPNQEKQGQPESSQPETTSCPNQEKQDQPESSQSIGLKSKPKKELEVIALPIQLRTPKLPLVRKKAQNIKSKKKAICPKRKTRPSLESIKTKLDFDKVSNLICKQTCLIEQQLTNVKCDIHKTNQLLEALLINRADILLTCTAFAYLLEDFQPNERKASKQATKLIAYLESTSCLRADFINDINNLIILKPTR
ncbi:hypothetical protein, partial [Shewanella kaireitica]|uniref:hypothetical protein n=1 Tax=Shewanella kaireitica TaxID=212021 RepID=UPI00200E88BF